MLQSSRLASTTSMWARRRRGLRAPVPWYRTTRLAFFGLAPPRKISDSGKLAARKRAAAASATGVVAPVVKPRWNFDKLLVNVVGELSFGLRTRSLCTEAERIEKRDENQEKQTRFFHCRHAGILPRAGLFKQLLQRRTLLCTVLVLARFPQNLTEDAQSEFGVSSGKPKAVDKATDFVFGRSGRGPLRGCTRPRFQIAAGAESVKQKCGEALEISGGGGDMFLRSHGGLGLACEFVEAHSPGLAKVHGAMFFARRNAQEPMAVAEVFIRKTTLLRTEKEGDAAPGEMLTYERSGLIQAADRMLQLSLSNGGGSDDECAIL